jgi:predicted kinase
MPGGAAFASHLADSVAVSFLTLDGGRRELLGRSTLTGSSSGKATIVAKAGRTPLFLCTTVPRLPAFFCRPAWSGESCLSRSDPILIHRTNSHSRPRPQPYPLSPTAGPARPERLPACPSGQRPPAPAERRPGCIAAQDPCAATMLLMAGLPGAGKTTRARQLAAVHRALRLTPDHWMIPLFGDPMAGGKRLVLEGRLISMALQALRLGTSVVLDFGLWGRDERPALRWLARSAGAACQVVYLPVAKDVQLARIAHRQATAPHQTFPMSGADVDRWREQFQIPDAAELSGGDIPGRQQGGQTGRSGQQATGPHAPTANPTDCPEAVLAAFVPASTPLAHYRSPADASAPAAGVPSMHARRPGWPDNPETDEDLPCQVR